MNENKNRDRYYGVRVGDIVVDRFSPVIKGEVVELCGHDNNRVFIKLESGKVFGAVAERLRILKEVK